MRAKTHCVFGRRPAVGASSMLRAVRYVNMQESEAVRTQEGRVFANCILCSAIGAIRFVPRRQRNSVALRQKRHVALRYVFESRHELPLRTPSARSPSATPCQHRKSNGESEGVHLYETWKNSCTERSDGVTVDSPRRELADLS